MSSRPRLAALFVAALLAGCKGVEEPTIGPAWVESDAEHPLSHEDCVRLATRSAPTAAAWQARLLGARAAVRQAHKLPNPVFLADWEDFGLPHGGGPVQQTYTLAYALDQLFSRKRRTAAATHDLEAEEATIRAEVLKLSAEVAHAYDGLVTARDRTALEGELETAAERQRHAVAALVEQGLSAAIDLERADADLAQAKADLVRAEDEARALALGFAFALGFERPVPLKLSEPLTALPAFPYADVTALLDRAAKDRPEIAAATARYEAERERLQLQADRIQFLPTIAGGPRYFGDEHLGVASIEVVLPVFDSGSAAEQSQSATLLAAAADLRATAHRVAGEVEETSNGLAAAVRYRDEHARDIADRRRVIREHLEKLFEAGEAEYGDLASAARDELEARLALLEADATAAAASVDLATAVGS